MMYNKYNVHIILLWKVNIIAIHQQMLTFENISNKCENNHNLS